MKVPLPVSPKRKLRSCSSPPAPTPHPNTVDRQTISKVRPESESEPEVTELPAKSPFFKKVIHHDLVVDTKKVPYP